MSGNKWRTTASDLPNVRNIGKMKIDTANEPSAAGPAVTDVSGFDPRHSFYPQTLLKAEDLRVSMPRPAKARYVRYSKALAAVVLAIGVGLSYMLFLSAPTTGPGAKDTSAASVKEGRSSAAAVGAITVPAASIPRPAMVAPALPAATITQAVDGGSAVASPAVALPVSVRQPAPRSPSTTVASRSAPQPKVSYAATPVAGPRSTVTHTKAAAEAAESAKAAPAQAAVATVAAPAAPVSNSRAGSCAEALAALGLCSPAARGDAKQ